LASAPHFSVCRYLFNDFIHLIEISATVIIYAFQRRDKRERLYLPFNPIIERQAPILMCRKETV
jgi:hypothetical protein